MDVETFRNLVSIDTEIATSVTNNDMLTNLSPFSRTVELLVHVSVEAERVETNFSSKLQVIETFFDRGQSSEL